MADSAASLLAELVASAPPTVNNMAYHGRLGGIQMDGTLSYPRFAAALDRAKSFLAGQE